MNLPTNIHSPYFSGQLFVNIMNPPTGRRSRKQSVALNQHYESLSSARGGIGNTGVQLLGNILKAAEKRQEEQFQQNFMFGVKLTIWRKGNLKQCTFFIDQNLPSFLWISTKTKAFLFDLAYTSIQRFSYEIESVIKIKDYFILYYFDQQLPIVFQGPNAAENSKKYFDLISNYILYNKIIMVYPSYFSKIMKSYVIEEIKDNVSRERNAYDVLRVSCDIGLNNVQYNLGVMKQILSTKGIKVQADLKTAYLSAQEITAFFKISNCCKGMRTIFENYAGIKLANYLQFLDPLMQNQSFGQFLLNEQQDSVQFVNQILQGTQKILSFYDFCTYLLNQQNNYAALAMPINQDLPLTDYYCYSSHNTYLSGNQLTSDSKIQRYLQDLDKGLKCVEIDVHNDGHRPIITHAFSDKSFCKPIDFEETIKAISQFCLKNQNHYPIILSIQNHAKEQNRYKMFNIIVQYFQNNLLRVNNDVDLNKLLMFRTLAQLKGKVIVKTDSKIVQIHSFKKNQIYNNQRFISNFSNLSGLGTSGNFPSGNFGMRFAQFQQFSGKYKDRKSKFLAEIQRDMYLPLAEMTKITGMFKAPQGVQTENSCGYECTSLTNQKAAKMEEGKIIHYTKRSWLRIYPGATQISSSNYNPVPHLYQGAQIIALNTQTKDDYAWLLMSYFTCGRELMPSKIGYIPKPNHLLSNSNQNRIKVFKTIKIQNLSNEKVTIHFFGSNRDMKNNNNKNNFIFNVNDYLQGFLIFDIEQKELKDCIPLRFIQRGFRVLVAKNQFFRDSGTRVLIHIDIKQSQGN